MMIAVPGIVRGVVLSWLWVEAALACPRVSVVRGPTGTGVVIAVEENVGWLLTAAHVALHERVEVAFITLQSYPEVAWYGRQATVVARWPDQDLALVRFQTGGRTPPVLTLAPAWQRPRRFPAMAWSIGLGPQGTPQLLPEQILAREYVEREGKRGVFFWQTATAPVAGRSGGPLLDAQRRVIGIAVAARGARGYYAHHDEILAALYQAGYGRLIPSR
ncbi:MAG: serine protease [Gemmataceae bacterium]|nr:serine protease [Gemmataceae bacterium]MCS7271087.1 serine protease [Gemmataceae bacterium]MDW8244645.1 serine protease [Thermogemmata sp.]